MTMHKTLRIITAIALVVALTGCQTSGVLGGQDVRVDIPDQENPADPEAPDPSDQQPVDVTVKELTPGSQTDAAEDTDGTGDGESQNPSAQEPTQPEPQQAQRVVKDKNVSYTVQPTEQTYVGGAVTYNYVPNKTYQLFVQPFHVTDIRLQPGETLVSQPAAGDTTNFVISTGKSFDQNQRVEHVYLKPVYADRETTLTINTDRRTYSFRVKSLKDTYMPIVSFRYPLDERRRLQRQAKQQNQSITVAGDVTSFDFGYEIIPNDAHKPAWTPSVVFTDGKRTYLQFHSAHRASYAPVLFAIGDNGERQIINYQVRGDYFVASRVIEHAELVMDANEGNIVTIIREEKGE
jgi:type IV secretion system protein VirB9